jgi:FAD/FMN-containing dehydrogenase
MAETWENWSGSVKTSPATIETPVSEDAIVSLVNVARANKRTVRGIGSGHSFTPLCAADDGILLSLDNMQGLIAADRAARTATFHAGTKLHAMGDPLREAGLAMENMGDVDRQALAGAVATGTHGTGHGIGSISNQVIGLRLVNGRGEVVECSETSNPELLKAAQVSLGALGIVTQITLRAVPAYNLHEREWRVTFDACMARLDAHIHENRHFEFFWDPGSDECLMKSLNPTDRKPDPLDDLENERIDFSHRIFPSDRNTKFNEIEFAVPESKGPDCLRELRALMRTKHKAYRWPLEYRTVAADDIYLSPCYRRDSVTISAHESAKREYEPFFRDCEAIFRNHQGRPHWGKLHWHTRGDLEPLYPKWSAFEAARKEHDPDGIFLNPYLRSLFG